MNELSRRINWRGGLLRLWLVASGFWIVSQGVTLTERGGFDFSDRLLKFEVAGEPFVFPAEDQNTKIVASIVARSAAKAKKDNERSAERCAAAKASSEADHKQAGKSEVSPTSEVFDPYAAGGVDRHWMECLPEVGLIEPMVVGPVYEARGRVLPPLGVTWCEFLLSGLLPPLSVMVLGCLWTWIARGFRA